MSAKNPRDTQILIVDDEKDFREVLGVSFRRMGYQVLLASNGRDAFDVVRSTPVDVVISDIRMPGGDGIEFLDRAKAFCAETPIVLLVTGFADISTELAHSKGAEALFSKPFDRKIVQETIIRLLTPTDEKWTRQNHRINAGPKIELRLPGFSEAIRTKVVSLGRGGMFVALSQRPFPNVNDDVSFNLLFDGDPTNVSGSGTIRWVRTKESSEFPAGCGVEFSYLDEPARNRILEFLEWNRPKPFIPDR